MPGNKAEKLLVVSQSGANVQTIRRALEGSIVQRIVSAPSGVRARQKLARETLDLVLIVTPLVDEFGADLAVELASQGRAGVILMVRPEIYEQVVTRVAGSGIIVLSKHASRADLLQAAGVMTSMVSRIRTLSQENSRLRRRLDDLGTISRAKCVLIEKRSMTEQEAHRYLEKQAMDTSCTMRSVAEQVIAEEET